MNKLFMLWGVAYFFQKTASEIQEVESRRSSDESAQNRYQETSLVSGTQGLSNLPTSETWRTWSMRRAGFTDEDFEGMEWLKSSAIQRSNRKYDLKPWYILYCTAAEISPSGLDGVKKGNTNKSTGDSMNEKNRTASSPEDVNKTHIKSRLQQLQSELSSVLHSLRSPPDDVVTSKVIVWPDGIEYHFPIKLEAIL